MAFDQSTRNRLARFVSDARRILTDEFTRQCKQDYGIDPDTGEVSDVARLTHLNDTQRATARILRETLDHYVAGSPSGGKKATIDRIVREQAFTTLNRLCAVRMAEARGIVIESVGKGPQSKGFSLYARVAGSALGETADAYRVYLFSIFDELALDLPPLFDRFSPKGRLFPSATALDSLLAEINHVDLDPLWGEDETIGWLYQYFNSIEERKQMRDESGAPRNSRELAVRNQFFTPRYVVEFLTDNTLGRIWYEMTKGETALKDACRYLVRRPREIFLAEGQQAPAQDQSTENLSQEELLKQPLHIPHRPLKDPRGVRLLDPACGSMHFGLYAFDLFTTIYDEAWELARGPADARPKSPAFADFIPFAATFSNKAAFLREVPRLIIEHNIHGIDIDPRAVQIAGLSLWLRAQRAWHQSGVRPADRPRITRSHIVCAEPMPGEKALLQEFVQLQFQESERPIFGYLLDQVVDQMKLAGEAGSLLRIDESIRTLVAEAKRRWAQGPKYEQSPLFPEAVAKPGHGQMRLDLSGITDEQFWERAEQRIYDALRAYSEKAENGGGFQRRLFANDAAQGFALIDVCRTRYDVAVMNPPFGLMPTAIYPYLVSNYPHAYSDLALTFMDRGLACCCDGGLVGAITSRAFLNVSDAEKFRRRIALSRMCLLGDLGADVMDDAFVDASAQVLSKNTSSELWIKDARKASPKHVALQAFLASDVTSPCRSFRLAHFERVPKARIAYDSGDVLGGILSAHNAIEPVYGIARTGASTFEDDRFLRLVWEVDARNLGSKATWCWIARTAPDFCQYYYPYELATKWSGDGAELCERNKQVNGQVAQARQGSSHYFQLGIVFSRRSRPSIAFRVHPSGTVFSSGCGIVFPKRSDTAGFLLGVLNSRYVRAAIHTLTTYSYTVGHIRAILAPRYDASKAQVIADLAMQLVHAKREVFRLNETDHSFCTLSSPMQRADTLRKSFDRLKASLHKWKSQMLADAALLDAAVAQLYEIDEDVDTARFGITAENSVLPKWLLDLTPAEYGARLVSEAVGLVFGRWDVRYATGHVRFPELGDPFGPLVSCPRGALQSDDGFPMTTEVGRKLMADGQYPLDVAWDGILVDDAEHPLDIGRRVRATIATIWEGLADAVEQELCGLLKVSELDEWFSRLPGFFADHLARYSKSRRQAPIYWPLSTPSGSYALWLYYHRLTDQTLFKTVNDFVEPKLQQIASQAAALRGRASRSSADTNELARLSDLEIELKEFRDELLRLAKVWKPNLNDGVVITAAPLWKLFQYKPWQKKLKETWQALEAGEYDWAHLAYSLWPERVREKCKHDKSLAIAHGLEELYQEPPAAAGKKRGRKPKVADPELMEDTE